MSALAHSSPPPIEKSRQSIERLLRTHHAEDFLYGTRGGHALISFRMHNWQLRFYLPLPDNPTGMPTAASVLAKREHACALRWRGFVQLLKVKLETIAVGASTFEQEFLAYIVMPSGDTVAQEVVPRISQAYADGSVEGLLEWTNLMSRAA